MLADAARLRQMAHDLAAMAEALTLSESVPPVMARLTARTEIRRVAVRHAIFGPSIDEASWMMLLDLYLAIAADRRVSISSLCLASRVPPTTALVRVRTMAHSGLIRRERDRRDARRHWASLTPTSIEMLGRYFVAVSS